MVLQTNLAGVPPAAYVELTDYLRTSGSTLRPSEAIGRAIQHWIAAQREAAEPVRGYQWKCLFLPAGSRIRMRHGEHSYYAEVVGEDLLYQGMPVSPRQFTVMVAGEGRNAWRDIWVRLHGEKQWASAAKLRRALERRPADTSPVEAMAAAARTMSDALQTTLTLVEHVHHKASLRSDQRIAKRRRVEDMALDD
jgi:hypothetical protein